MAWIKFYNEDEECIGGVNTCSGQEVGPEEIDRLIRNEIIFKIIGAIIFIGLITAATWGQ